MDAAIYRDYRRLAALESYRLLDTPPEVQFDRLTRIAAAICATPISAISLVDRDRQWFKAVHGLPVRQTDIASSFCKHAICQKGTYIVEDASRHPLFWDNPLVTGDPWIRFYAGCPLVTSGGYALGALIVIDRVPRQLSKQQIEDLEALAEQTMLAFELRRQRLEFGELLDESEHDEAVRRHLKSNAAKIGDWQLHLRNGQLTWSEEALTLLGADTSATPSLQDVVQRIHAADRPRWRESFSACSLKGVPMDIECEFESFSGMPFTLRWVATAERDAQGKVNRMIGAVQDVSERRRLELGSRKLNERFQIVAELSSDVIWEWDLQQQSIWWSEGIQHFFGHAYNAQATSIDVLATLLHPEERVHLQRGLTKHIEDTQTLWRACHRFLRADGSYAWVENRARILRDDSGKALRLVGTMTDISRSKAAEAEREESAARLKHQAALLDKAKDAIVVTDMGGRILFWNGGAQRLYGWTASEAVGKVQWQLLNEGCSLATELVRILSENEEWSREVVQYHKDGSRLQVHCHWTLVRRDNGEPQSIFAINTDVTQARKDQERIQYLAFYDPLTNLPNRFALMDRLQQALAASHRNQHLGALFFLDLDDFKTLNDTLGHDKGDLLLQQVGHRLLDCVRETDTVARLGGDEFVVLLQDLGTTSAEAAIQAESVAEKILCAFSKPFHLDSYLHDCTTSIGVTLFNGQQVGVDELLKQADLAMYEAKRDQRNTICFFDPGMQKVVLQRASIEADLRRASMEQEFELHYQPQWGRDSRPSGVEALVRWRHPTRGLLYPDEFIPIAEEMDLIVPLGRWVLNRACAQQVLWRTMGLPPLRVSVNVSARQFRHPEFVGHVKTALKLTGADPYHLELELTESMLIKDVQATAEKMTGLKKLGVRFALDDFGTGYSSLSLLRRLPLDQLKIDQSFVRGIDTDEDDEKVVQSIIALGKNLNLRIIAEGVETLSQQALLTKHGCDEFQGFLYGVPRSASEISETMLAMSDL